MAGSDEPLPLKLMAMPAVPVYGPPGLAIGAWEVTAVMVTLAVAEALTESVLVTVRVAV
nr:hypothetical protein [Granulicella tundricola]